MLGHAGQSPRLPEAQPAHRPPNETDPRRADAQLVDTKGAPVAGELLLLCGTNICSRPVQTNAQGSAHFNLCLNMLEPALKYLGNGRYVSFGVAMTAPIGT